MTTSVKHRNFVREPMGERLNTDLAGIGPVYGAQLERRGYDKAYTVLGRFLLLKKDREDFTVWLMRIGTVNAGHANACYACLREWSDQHM